MSPVPTANPRHSWRVLILPYLGARGLYERYDFDQPWDSPHNAALTLLMPEVYACPADPAARRNGEASYRVVVGSHAAFTGSQPRKPPEFVDDRRFTILVVEAPVSGITWLEPQDLAADRIDLLVNSGLDRGVGSHHEGGANVLMADGAVRFLKNTTPADILQGMLSIDGGEEITADAVAE